jgi:very-short-patch-repair endonuclease
VELVTLTVVSEVHAKVIHFLESRGVQLIEEVPFPPYTVDIYIPDYHIAVEVDGPQHSKKNDTKRDKVLIKEYKLWMFRVTDREFNSNPLKFYTELHEFMNSAINSAEYRYEKVADKIPWI